jgi:RNA polymerase sigma-70 factor (ECF subfamily)
LEDRGGDEVALIEAAREGDARAFERLLALHEARVYRVLRLLGVARADRDDVAQDAFLRIFRGLVRFTPGGRFDSWVYKIAVNAARDWREQADRRKRDEAPWEGDRDDFRPAAGPGAAEQLDLARRLEAALALLSHRERAVFVLVEMEGMERTDVARTLGITGITVRRHLSLAKERLRGALEEKLRRG